MVINTTINIYGAVRSKPIENDPIAKKNKVYGLSFPTGSRLEGGFFSKESGLRLVKNNLKQLLLTERGERVMLPNYGVSLKKYLFQPLDETTFESIKQEILTSLSRYSKGTHVLRLRVGPTDGARETEISSLKISLLIKIKEIENTTTEVEVTI